jgi:hypothetical protein
MDKKEFLFRTVSVPSIVFALVMLLLFLSACKSTTPVVVSENRTESRLNGYRETITDSVFVFKHDSVFVKHKGDTVFVDRWRSSIEYRSKTDTVHVSDSIYVNKNVVEVKETNRLNGFQNFQIWCGRILLFAGLLIVVYLLVKWRLKW